MMKRTFYDEREVLFMTRGFTHGKVNLMPMMRKNYILRRDFDFGKESLMMRRKFDL